MFTKYRLCAKTFIIVLVNLQYHPSSLIPYSKLLEIVRARYWTQLPDNEDCRFHYYEIQKKTKRNRINIKYQFHHVKSLEIVILMVKTEKKSEKQILFMNQSDNWSCRASHHSNIWITYWKEYSNWNLYDCIKTIGAIKWYKHFFFKQISRSWLLTKRRVRITWRVTDLGGDSQFCGFYV